jgi:hypothetical protein
LRDGGGGGGFLPTAEVDEELRVTVLVEFPEFVCRVCSSLADSGWSTSLSLLTEM